MHEMTIAQNIIRIVEESRGKEAFEKVHCVRIEIGALAAVDSAALQFSFEAAIEHTPLQGAVLDICHIEGVALCGQCNQQVKIQQYYDACPLCGSYQLELLQGAEMSVKNIEVE